MDPYWSWDRSFGFDLPVNIIFGLKNVVLEAAFQFFYQFRLVICHKLCDLIAHWCGKRFSKPDAGVKSLRFARNWKNFVQGSVRYLAICIGEVKFRCIFHRKKGRFLSGTRLRTWCLLWSGWSWSYGHYRLVVLPPSDEDLT